MLARAVLAMALVGLCLPAAAGAVPAAGIVGTTTLGTFDTAAPGSVTTQPITGLAAMNETFIGLDTRPGTGELIGTTVPIGIVGSALIRTYKIDPGTGVATFTGSIPNTVAGAGDYASGFDFQPLVDRIRVVNSINENFRINPNNGTLAGDDVNLTFTAPATGPVVAVAYDRNVAPGPPGTPADPNARVTLYGIDVGADLLVTQGGIDGSAPGGPNGGTIASVGPLGVDVDSSAAGFDITASGAAYAVLQTAAGRSLYTVNLATGAVTEVGVLGAAVRDFTVLTPDYCPFLVGEVPVDQDGDGFGDRCDNDIDGDGIVNATEEARGTDPRNPDSDADGIQDGVDICPKQRGTGPDGCDHSAPTITIRKAPKRLTHKRFFNGVRCRISVGEEARLDVVLLGRARSARVAKAGDVVLAEKHLGRSAKTRAVRLRPRRALVARSARFTVRLQVTATDAAGNRRTKTKKIVVRG